jgi:hypothetical protein
MSVLIIANKGNALSIQETEWSKSRVKINYKLERKQIWDKILNSQPTNKANNSVYK